MSTNVEDGVAFLRGPVERPELIEDLIERVRKVNGVRDVASLLHVQAWRAVLGLLALELDFDQSELQRRGDGLRPRPCA